MSKVPFMQTKRISLFIFIFFAIFAESVQAQTISVKGKITDPNGKPVISASIKVRNGNLGTSSDTLGNFNISLNPSDALMISAIGFADTTLSINHRSDLTIILIPRAKALKEVVVSGEYPNSGLPSPEEITREQIIASAFENYLNGAVFSNGIIASSSYDNKTNQIVRTTTVGFGALNTINSGAMLPVVEHKEDTRGSRYLLNRFAKGIVVGVINNFMTV
jgi:hypothetical protein